MWLRGPTEILSHSIKRLKLDQLPGRASMHFELNLIREYSGLGFVSP